MWRLCGRPVPATRRQRFGGQATAALSVKVANAAIMPAAVRVTTPATRAW
jgi:hypothetical protein